MRYTRKSSAPTGDLIAPGLRVSPHQTAIATTDPVLAEALLDSGWFDEVDDGQALDPVLMPVVAEYSGDVDVTEYRGRPALLSSVVSPGAPTASPVRPAAGLFLGGSPVADNVQVARLSKSDGVITQSTSRSRHRLTGKTNTVRLVYWNGALNYSAFGAFEEGDWNFAFDLKASVEKPGGYVEPVYFQGRRTATIDKAGLLVSDPVALSEDAGTDFWVRSRASGTGGAVWPYQRDLRPELGEGIVNGSDLVDSGTVTAVGAATPGLMPVAIITDAAYPSVAMEGDSVMWGLGDDEATPQFKGFVRRALNRQLGYVGLSRSGARAEYVATPGVFRSRLLLALGCTHAVSNFGINDVGGTAGGAGVLGSRTAAQLEADWLTLAKMHQRGGTDWYQCTLTPYTSSSDNWATVGAQTVRALPAREQANDWLRDGCPIDPSTKAPVAVGTSGALRTVYITWNGTAFVHAGTRAEDHPIAGAFEIADLVESSRNSGKWKTDGTAFKYVNNDTFGIHPSIYAYGVMAAGIDTSVFTL